jgi:hypothetical protein
MHIFININIISSIIIKIIINFKFFLKKFFFFFFFNFSPNQLINNVQSNFSYKTKYMLTDQLVGWGFPPKQLLMMILMKSLHHQCEASHFDKGYQPYNDHQWLIFRDGTQLINIKIFRFI